MESEMDAIALERRLTLIESAQTNAAILAAANHATVMQAVGKVEGKVETQNGRVGRLEVWKAQSSVVYGGILFAAPFLFYGLLRLFGEG